MITRYSNKLREKRSSLSNQLFQFACVFFFVALCLLLKGKSYLTPRIKKTTKKIQTSYSDYIDFAYPERRLPQQEEKYITQESAIVGLTSSASVLSTLSPRNFDENIKEKTIQVRFHFNAATEEIFKKTNILFAPPSMGISSGKIKDDKPAKYSISR